ncbi:MAG: hypothetical protein ACRDCE_07880 [Cetobacterium sp.]|uniref:hypothetical protein n=1 Tax=Cetobacterium sp. TaxID=2071632 RepID=UPI003EE58184
MSTEKARFSYDFMNLNEIAVGDRVYITCNPCLVTSSYRNAKVVKVLKTRVDVEMYRDDCVTKDIISFNKSAYEKDRSARTARLLIPHNEATENEITEFLRAKHMRQLSIAAHDRCKQRLHDLYMTHKSNSMWIEIEKMLNDFDKMQHQKDSK